MAEPFQNIRNKYAKYDRPNQKWVCGKVCDGAKSCYFGPDQGGHCQAGKEVEGRTSGECLPKRQGSTWLCTRQESRGGDPCKQGPLPDGSCCHAVTKCVPRLSLRTIRGRVTFSVAVATVGFMIALLWGGGGSPEQPPAGLSAGPLSVSHTFLSTDCSKCHSQMQLTPDRLVQFHPSAFESRAKEDGGLCLKCHTEIGGRDGSLAFLPHSAPASALQSHKPDVGGARGDVVLVLASRLTPGDLHSKGGACTTCHTEHHGLEANLKDLSNHQCQVCHSGQFKSFSEGHPEFRTIGYPYNRRTRIYFDHYSHYEDHFVMNLKSDPETVPDGFNPADGMRHNESKSCASCHITTKSGGQMTVNSFEAACAKCHRSATFRGNRVAVLAIPQIAAPNAAPVARDDSQPDLNAGTWKSASASVDLPWPMLQFMDFDARQSWANLRAQGVALGDVSKADDAQRKDIANVLWGIKSLIADLSNADGLDRLRRRLLDSADAQADVLIRGFPPNVFDALRKTTDPAAPVGTSSTSANLDRMLQETEAHQSALKKEHEDFMNKAFPVAAAPPPPAAMPMPAAGAPPPISLAGLGGSAPPAPAAGPPSLSGNLIGGPASAPAPAPPPAATPPPSLSGSLLGGSPPPAAPPAATPPTTPPPSLSGNLIGGLPPATTPPPAATPPPSLSGNLIGGLSAAPPPPEAPAADATAEPAKPLEPDSWATTGGWQEENGIVYYKSTGHADPVIRAWIEEMLAQSNHTDRVALLTLLNSFDFRKGVKSTLSGSCFKCHTVDNKYDASGNIVGLTVNWKTYGSSEPASRDLRALSKFKHSSHVLSTECRICHSTITAEADRLEYASFFPVGIDEKNAAHPLIKTDPKDFHSNFGPISKGVCVRCHTESGAGNKCVDCHLYHLPPTGDFNPMLDRLRLHEAPPVAAVP